MHQHQCMNDTMGKAIVLLRQPTKLTGVSRLHAVLVAGFHSRASEIGFAHTILHTCLYMDCCTRQKTKASAWRITGIWPQFHMAACLVRSLVLFHAPGLGQFLHVRHICTAGKGCCRQLAASGLCVPHCPIQSHQQLRMKSSGNSNPELGFECVRKPRKREQI